MNTFDVQKFLNHIGEQDPSWPRARGIVQHQLRLPDNLKLLIRNGWRGVFGLEEFLRGSGFSGLNPSCLLDAAVIPTDGRQPRPSDLAKAIELLGVRQCSVVLAINATVRSFLRSKPPVGWKKLLEEMIQEIEIGAKFGVRAGNLGRAEGLLAGFSRAVGRAVLFGFDAKGYKQFLEMERKFGKVGRKIMLEVFGCEPYQVSAFAIQELGFGADAAIGFLCGLGNLKLTKIELNQEAERWVAAVQWIEALKAGRNYPPKLATREFFPSIAPPRDRSSKNPNLETLYTEVAKARREGSLWTWHLPKPGYERTREVLGL